MVTPGPEESSPRQDSSVPGGASDQSLLRRLQEGRTDASTELYLRYAQRLMALATAQTSSDLIRRVDPEDIVQSVFRTFFRRAALGQYTVPEGEELWKLLLVIALNKIRATAAYHRAGKRDVKRTFGGEAYDLAIQLEAGHDETALTALRLVIESLLHDLPGSHRKMTEMRIEGHEVNEIATAVQRSKRSVERELQEFRRRLHALIDED
jgi:DNA-directed RNA polymerase specialized sigma24 family protein